MKTLFFSLALSLSVMISKANHNFSQLNLKFFDNSNFTLVFDHQKFHAPSSSFNLNNLTPGNHRVKIFKKSYGYNQPHHQMVFNGFIAIPAGTQVFAMIDYYNQLNIVSQTPLYASNNYGYDNCSDDNYDGYYNNYNAGYCAPVAPVCMSNQAFNQLMNTISNTTFDSNKLQIANQAISMSGITSSQVLSLMNLLTFESNKLSLAESAYPYTIDKQNYFMVNNGFTFSSSISTLNNYISRF